MNALITMFVLLLSQTQAAPTSDIVCRGKLGEKPVQLESELTSDLHRHAYLRDPDLGGFVYLATIEGETVRLQIKSDSSRTSLLDQRRPLKDAKSLIHINRQTTAQVSCEREAR